MITELKKVNPTPTGGRVIEVIDYNIRNYRLQTALEALSRCLLFCVECDSNNTNSKNIPSDTRGILLQWDIVKKDFEFSMEHNDFPTGSHEYAFSIALLSQKEIQRVRNVKMKRVIGEMFNAARVMLSVDSANTQGYIALVDAESIRKMFSLVDDMFKMWLGTGAEEELGLTAPAYEKLGEVQPDVDSDFAKMLEPSSSMPKPKLDDVADTEL
jgi:hypothetical protein